MLSAVNIGVMEKRRTEGGSMVGSQRENWLRVLHARWIVNGPSGLAGHRGWRLAPDERD